MRRLSLYLATALGFCFLAACTTQAAQTKQVELLLDAIAEIESNNDPNAIGDGGRAVGMYQIHRRYWQDGTKILGVDWQHSEARDPEKARQVVRAYLRHYGRGKDLLDMARIHNGGPRGHRKKATLRYARRIEAILEDAPQTS